ncbi:MAG TPA: hypothetical protein VET66_15045 [Steroidobacteraceae bacterium]|nr:hypothetical protein [Steroidobacteraceae bacterium]
MSSTLHVGAPTGEPDLSAAAAPIPDVPPPPAPSSSPPPPPPAPLIGVPVELAAGLAKFPFAVIAERRLTVPVIGSFGGRPLWKLTDEEANLVAPLIKWYLDQLMPQGSPAQQLVTALGVAFAARFTLDRATRDDSPQPQQAATPSGAPVPEWAVGMGQASPPDPVTGGEASPREQQPTRASFWAGGTTRR